jgi:hypothetical protein
MLQIIRSTIIVVFTVTYSAIGSNEPFNRSQVPESVIEKIRTQALDDYSNYKQARPEEAVSVLGGIYPQIDKFEVNRIYNYYYGQIRHSRLYVFLRKLGVENPPDQDEPLWVIIIGLSVIFGFWTRKTGLEILNAVYTVIKEWIYKKCAGTKLFRGIALNRYRRNTYDEFKTLKMNYGASKSFLMRDIYVPLQIINNSNGPVLDAFKKLSKVRRLIIKGQPGSGKTIFLKWIVLSYAEGRLGLNDQPVPILISLNKLNTEPHKTVEDIESIIVHEFKMLGFPQARRFVLTALDKGALMLLFDGLDEVNSKLRPAAIGAIKETLKKYKNCRAIITCRSAVYNDELAERTDDTLEVAEFSDQQIRKFLNAWKSKMPPERSAEKLLHDLRERPAIYNLARNPLMLSMISYLYCDTAIQIPHSRSQFYSEATSHLLSLIDIRRGIPNKYEFIAKKRLLQHLATQFYLHPTHDKDSRSVSSSVAVDYTRNFLDSVPTLDPETDTIPILNEITERSGLLLSLDSGARYQFTHLTLQEYFCAEELSAEPDILIKYYKEYRDNWLGIVKLCCGLMNVPEASKVINQVYEIDNVEGLECLADAQVVAADVLREKTEDAKKLLNDPQHSARVARALGSIAADEHGGRELRTYLLEEFNRPDQKEKMVFASCLASTNRSEAAEALAHSVYVNNDDTIRNSLLAMGDMSVPCCKAAAERGLKAAVIDLAEIGTPKAANALTDLLWNDNRSLAIPAAVKLAGLIEHPEIEDVLDTYESREQQDEMAVNEWVWYPFSRNPRASMTKIVGRIFTVLAEANKKDDGQLFSSTPPPAVDPRIAIPFCGVEIYDRVEYCLKTTPPEEMPDKLDLPPVWKLIASSLNKKSYGNFWANLNAFRNRNRQEDWKHVFKKIDYNFHASSQFWIVVCVCIMFSAMALADILRSFWSDKLTMPDMLLLPTFVLPAYFILSFWSLFVFGFPRHYDPMVLLKIGILGWLYYFKGQIDLFKGRFFPWISSVPILKVTYMPDPSAQVLQDYLKRNGRISTPEIEKSGYSLFSFFFYSTTFLSLLFFIYQIIKLNPVPRSEAFFLAFILALAGILAAFLTEVVAVAEALAENGNGVGWGLVAKVLISVIVVIMAAAIPNAATGTKAGVLTGIEIGIIAVTPQFAKIGVNAWLRVLNGKIDSCRLLSPLALPFFLWLPFTAFFSFRFLLRAMSAAEHLSLLLVIGIYVIFSGLCCGLWGLGRRRERSAKNPFRDLLPYSVSIRYTALVTEKELEKSSRERA